MGILSFKSFQLPTTGNGTAFQDITGNMSSASSVASSFASLDSSVTQLEKESVAGDAYSDDFARTEDSLEPSAPLSVDVITTEPEQEDPDEYYDDDAFEVEEENDKPAPADADREPGEYSDDWDEEAPLAVDEWNDSVVDGPVFQQEALLLLSPHGLVPAEGKDNSELHGDLQDDPPAAPRGAIDQAVNSPEVYLAERTRAWAQEKLRLVTQTKTTFTPAVPCPLKERSFKSISPAASAALLQKLRHRRPRETTIASAPPVPTQWIERARVHKLLAHMTASPPPLPRQKRRTATRSLSTFCAVKTADVQGRLATQRLDELCARWETPHDDADAMGIATAEVIAALLQQQRRVLGGPNATVLKALKTQATSMDRAVETATLAVADARALLLDAQRILHAPDAHVCTC